MCFVAALGHVDNVFAVQGVVGHRTVHGFLYPQPFAVLLERRRGAGLHHLLELPALFPGVAPGTVTRRVANHIAGYGVGYRRVGANLHAVLGQLVPPVAVPVGVSHGFLDRSDRSGRIRVPLLIQHVAAQVVGIYPGGVGGAAGRIVLVVYPDQLAQIVINIVGGLAVLDNGREVVHIVVGVGEVLALLRNTGNLVGGDAPVKLPTK